MPIGQQREDEERQQRELHVEVEQDHDRADQRQRGLEQRHDGVGDEAVERLDVVGHARDQHARRAALVEADRQLLQVREDPHAQVRRARAGRPSRRGRSARRSRPRPRARETRNATTISVERRRGRPCWMPLSIAALASSGGASDAAVPTTQRDEHQHDARAGTGAAGRSRPRRLRPRAARAAQAPAQVVAARRRAARPRRRRSQPATSRSRGLRVRKTWSGRPFSTISRYSSDGLEQLVVVAVGDDPAVVEHDDLVGQRDRREAVGDHERRAPRHRLASASLISLLGRGVDRGGRVVEDQDARVGQQRARDRQALALAAGERQPALADARVVALGQALDELVRPARAARPLDLLGASRRRARRRCSRRPWRENRNGSSPTTAIARRSEAQVDVAHVGAVDAAPAPALDVVQARDQRDEARLARAGGADQRDRAPGGTSRSTSCSTGPRGARRSAA